MTFLTPISTAIIGWAALALGGLAVIAYVLKMRRRRFEVPFSMLWHRVLREKEATSLWKRLKRLLSLLLVLLMLALLLVAALEPELGEADDEARSVVILLDASASMKARDAGEDGEATRMEAAKAEVRRILDSLGGGDAAMVMRMDGQTTPLTRFESDMPRLKKLVEGVQPSDTPADLRRALGAAADALRDRQNPTIILVGDGAYEEEALGSAVWAAGGGGGGGGGGDEAAAGAAGGQERLDAVDLSAIDVSYVPVGSTGENVGIVSFNARRYATDKTSYEVYIEVQNFGQEVARRKLVLYNGDLATDVRTLELGPGEKLRQIYSRGGGEDSVLRASLELDAGDQGGEARRDAFPLDDEAWALLPARRKQKVLLVTKDNLYLEGAMLVYDNIAVDKLTPEEFDAAVADGTLPEYSAVVLDDHTPAALPPPPTHLLYFNPAGEHSPFRTRGRLRGPRITELNDDHPVMRWLVMSDVNFDETSVFSLDRERGEVALASSVRDPIIAARRSKERKVIACGFSLSGTDLMLRVAFPLFLVNSLDWFAADEADLMTTYPTGSRVRVPMDGVLAVSEAEVVSPTGRTSRAPLVDGFASFYAAEVGVHRLAARDGDRVLAEVQLAANLSSPTESDIAPSSELILGGKTLAAPAGFTAS
ncbi:MAG TPA: VWA domain-containing protein, partial [Kofleriaceae bacterium]|nr:VWA domain-containing protein [Kofleriaceae bacterium]